MDFQNLVEVRKNHYFNINKLNSWLQVHYNKFGSALSVKQFIGGQSNPTFVIGFKNQKKLILRKKPPGILLPSAHAIEREYKVQKALEDSKVPCPKMLVICNDDAVIGTPFYLMEAVIGKVYDNILDIKDIEIRKSIYLQSVKMLAILHNVKFIKIGLGDFGKTGNYVKRQILRWEKQWHLSKQREVPEMLKIVKWLNKNIPDFDDTTLVHGDFRLGNIIYGENNRINAILDWELSTLGHPFSDLGYLIYPHYLSIGERHGLNGVDYNNENIPTVNEIIKVYCETRGIKEFDPTFYVILSMFRSISILEGVYARSIKGNASSPSAKLIGKDVIPLAKTAHKIIKSL